jgi:hypothetical protein
LCESKPQITYEHEQHRPGFKRAFSERTAESKPTQILQLIKKNFFKTFITWFLQFLLFSTIPVEFIPPTYNEPRWGLSTPMLSAFLLHNGLQEHFRLQLLTGFWFLSHRQNTKWNFVFPKRKLFPARKLIELPKQQPHYTWRINLCQCSLNFSKFWIIARFLSATRI